jgi:hypothetical protein
MRGATRGGAVREVLARAERENAAVSDKVMARFCGQFDPALVEPDRFRDPEGVFHAVHLPKTGGMSLGKSLAGAMGFHAVPWFDTRGSFLPLDAQAREAAQMGAGPQVVMGHFGWGELVDLIKAGRSLHAMACVRDPVARLVSNFDYNRSIAHPNFEDFRAKNPSFEIYVSRQALNPQLKQLIGHRPDFELTLAALSTHYSFLGVAEAMGAGLAHLQRSHGLSGLLEHRQNAAISRGQTQSTQVTPEFHAKIYQAHFEDLRLHLLLSKLYDVSSSAPKSL